MSFFNRTWLMIWMTVVSLTVLDYFERFPSRTRPEWAPPVGAILIAPLVWFVLTIRPPCKCDKCEAKK